MRPVRVPTLRVTTLFPCLRFRLAVAILATAFSHATRAGGLWMLLHGFLGFALKLPLSRLFLNRLFFSCLLLVNLAFLLPFFPLEVSLPFSVSSPQLLLYADLSWHHFIFWLRPPAVLLDDLLFEPPDLSPYAEVAPPLSAHAALFISPVPASSTISGAQPSATHIAAAHRTDVAYVSAALAPHSLLAVLIDPDVS